MVPLHPEDLEEVVEIVMVRHHLTDLAIGQVTMPLPTTTGLVTMLLLTTTGLVTMLLPTTTGPITMLPTTITTI